MPVMTKAKVKQFALGALVAALGAGSYVIAEVTFTDFQSGTTISAKEMNDKLNALKAAVNANTAAVICPANTPTRFTDNKDGTICDSQTGLMWEVKTGTPGATVSCITPTACPDPHNVNNVYTWSAGSSTEPNGSLFTDFLARINRGASASSDGTTITRVGYTDWRVANIVELQTIIDTAACSGGGACIDPIFGPTKASNYWSSSSSSFDNAWLVNFNDGSLNDFSKSDVSFYFARAVRGGR